MTTVLVTLFSLLFYILLRVQFKHHIKRMSYVTDDFHQIKDDCEYFIKNDNSFWITFFALEEFFMDCQVCVFGNLSRWIVKTMHEKQQFVIPHEYMEQCEKIAKALKKDDHVSMELSFRNSIFSELAKFYDTSSYKEAMYLSYKKEAKETMDKIISWIDIEPLREADKKVVRQFKLY